MAAAYVTAVIDLYCRDEPRDRFCSDYSIPDNFSDLPGHVQNVLTHVFVDEFGFETRAVADAYNSVTSLQGLPPHPILASRAYEPEYHRDPAGWATHFMMAADMLAFREPDGSPVEIDARVATRLSAAYYFDIGLYVSGGFEFITTFAENAGVFNFDLAMEGGYHLTVLDHLGFEFFASLNLGYLMSNDLGLSTFDAGVGGGARIMIPLLDDPVKSNLPSLSIGIEYSRLLNCDLLPPDQLFFSTGVRFNYI